MFKPLGMLAFICLLLSLTGVAINAQQQPRPTSYIVPGSMRVTPAKYVTISTQTAIIKQPGRWAENATRISSVNGVLTTQTVPRQWWPAQEVEVTTYTLRDINTGQLGRNVRKRTLSPGIARRR